MDRKSRFKLALLATAFVSVAMNAPVFAQTKAPTMGGDLKVIVPQLPGTFGNVKDRNWTVGTSAYLFPAVETLVGLTKDGPAPTKLATSWESAPDGKTITFHLRKNVKFHDGTNFNAAAVKWNIELIKPSKAELAIISSMDVIDDVTIRFNLSEYSSTLLYNLAWYDGMMISPASVEGRDQTYVATHVVGTGPFKFETFKQNANATFSKFADYWDKGKPYLDNFEFVAVSDNNTARSALMSGQAHVWDYVEPKNIAGLTSAGYKVNTVPGVIRTAFGDSANADSPFAKVGVRQAIEYAVDKAALAKAFGAGTWEVPKGPCSVKQIGCDVAEKNEMKYDPKKAKQLLADAGYPNGFKTEILTKATVGSSELAALQAFLKAVGIDATINVLNAAKAASVATEGWKNGIFVQGLGVPSASYTQALVVDGPSPTKAKSSAVPAGYAELLRKADAAIDPAEQKKLSSELVTMLQKDATFATWYAESRNAAYGPKIHVDLDAISLFFWNPGDSWIEK